jgi:hypothetical protein
MDASTGSSIITSCVINASGLNMPTPNMTFVGSPANTTGSFAISGSYIVSCTVSTYGLTNIGWSGGGASATLLSAYSFFTATRIG